MKEYINITGPSDLQTLTVGRFEGDSIIKQGMMKINNDGLELIKLFEGLRLKSYICPAGVLTIGYGHTGGDVKAGMIITEEEAEELLRQDLERFEEGVENLVEVELNENQFSALVSLAYNIGLGNFKRSTLLKLINKGNQDELEFVHSQFKRWVYAGSKILPGLQRRREAEFDLYSKPLPPQPEYHCNFK